MFPDGFVQDLKNRADIVDVVGRFVQLKKQGSVYVGICPFHQDHKPSMRVTPSMGIYKCFACGAGGDVFKFVQEHVHQGGLTSTGRTTEHHLATFAVEK